GGARCRRGGARAGGGGGGVGRGGGAPAPPPRRIQPKLPTIVSRHPHEPQPQRSPSGAMGMWPTSPAKPLLPVHRRPSRTKALPTPVPSVRKRRLAAPRPPPFHASASPAPFPAFPTPTGRPTRH